MKYLSNPFFLLLSGFLLLVATNLTFGIGIMVWAAWVPFLFYLAQTKGWKSRLAFAGVLVVAWTVAVMKITTGPIPLFLAPLYGVPIALIQLPGFLIWARFRHLKGGWLLFPALMTVLEWVQYTFTPMGTWGSAANTQVDSIVMVQFVSLFGMAGLSFLIYLVNVVLVDSLLEKSVRISRSLVVGGVLLAAVCFGHLRYSIGKSSGQATLRVAAVGTDSRIGIGPLPSDSLRFENMAGVFNRTHKASDAGARLVVWNEAASMVRPEEEGWWQDSLSHLARESEIALVAAYVVMLQEEPMHYENKYLFLDAAGNINSTYLKHEPVPGEPAVRGTGSMTVSQVGQTSVGGAICYDYDFPYLAQEHGRINADLVALPSSDWRGIDPLHTRMSALRAVEQGHSVLRSTRFGLSAAITPFGEFAGQMSAFDQHSKIMVAELPVSGVWTLFGMIGDIGVYLCLGYLFVLLALRIAPRRPIGR